MQPRYPNLREALDEVAPWEETVEWRRLDAAIALLVLCVDVALALPNAWLREGLANVLAESIGRRYQRQADIIREWHRLCE